MHRATALSLLLALPLAAFAAAPLEPEARVTDPLLTIPGLSADHLDGRDSADFASAAHDHDDRYLAIDGKAADSDLLDGRDGAAYAAADHRHPQYVPGSATNHFATAFVMFDGSGAIKSQSNVSAVTRTGVGTYNITWMRPFGSPNYVLAGMCGKAGGNNDCFVSLDADMPAAGWANVKTIRGDRSLQDFSYVSVVMFGGGGLPP